MRRRGIGRVGRPTLIGTMARTAVVAGTASAVVGSSQKKQAASQAQAADAAAYQELQQQAAIEAQVQAQVAAQMAAQQQAPAAPPPPPPAAPAAAPAGDDTIAKLQQLAELKNQGILTEEEFAAQKAKLLGM
ncbi:MAG: SHOCT domain-containing protein [Ilumatobacteraceae bacterium]